MALGILAIMLALLFAGVPVAFALWLTGLFSVLFFNLSSLTQVAQSLYAGLDNFVLLAIPFFILAGNVLVRGQVATPIFKLLQNVTRNMTGGSATGASAACAAFGAMTGSSVASAAALARMTMIELTELGYPKGFVAGLLAAGGTLGILIPPSVVLVIYGSMAKTSVGDLFIAAVVPGLLVAAALTFTTWLISRSRGYGELGKTKRLPGELRRDTLAALPAFGIPLIVIGGIFSGYFTPTEAAAAAAIYGIFLATIVFRRMNLSGLLETFVESAKSTATILFIVSGAMFVGHVCTLAGLPETIVNAIQAMGLNWWQFLVVVNIALLILGCFLDGFTLLTVVTPLLLPSVLAVGINPIHFAIVLVLNIEIAAVTPPIGLNLFVLSSITGVPIGTVARGVLPFAATLLIALFVLSFIPSISLFVIQ